ncbi:MAG: roadblock/LC7 domain-containing protein [Candidatus Korarchaeota archaeon]|nr:roadblock/LC7 domain-containing protein [Candidatus Korarchaeota archaeon]
MSDLSEGFRSIVDGFREDVGDDLVLLAVFTPDGISLYSSLPPDVMEEFFLASSSSILEISKALLDHLGMGAVERCRLESDGAYIYLVPLSEDIYLSAALRKGADEERLRDFVDELRSFLRSD